MSICLSGRLLRESSGSSLRFHNPTIHDQMERAVNCSSENGLKGKAREMALAESSGKTCGGREGASLPGAVGLAPSPPGASAEEVLKNISIQGRKTHEFLKKDNIYPFQGEIWASSEQQCKEMSKQA